jgi:hypothetical protein
MGILDRLFGRKPAAVTIEEKPIEKECPHGSMAPHWEGPEDFEARPGIVLRLRRLEGVQPRGG